MHVDIWKEVRVGWNTRKKAKAKQSENNKDASGLWRQRAKLRMVTRERGQK